MTTDNEASYTGFQMYGGTSLLVDRVTKRCVYVDGKKQEDRITVDGVAISRISGSGVIGGTVLGSISLDTPDANVAAVKNGVMVVAKDCGPVNVRALDDFGKQTATTFAASIEVCGDAQEIISAGIAAVAGRTSTGAASSRKEVTNN